MNVQQRALAVQKAQGCPRCTSWQHKRKDCPMKPNSCGEDINGTKCIADHSKLLHGSGNVYCGVAKSKGLDSKLVQENVAYCHDKSDPFLGRTICS